MSTPVSMTIAALGAAALLGIASPGAVAGVSKPAAAAPAKHANSVVGVWIVSDETAPFPLHMYVFNADGTMQQANPDAGDPRTSDSDGKGIWRARRDRIVGKWVEITADRGTHKFAGRLELSFDLKVDGDRLTGIRSAQPFDVAGKPSGDPFRGSFTGTRVTLP
jgi:hypothetical protein